MAASVSVVPVAPALRVSRPRGQRAPNRAPATSTTTPATTASRGNAVGDPSQGRVEARVRRARAAHPGFLLAFASVVCGRGLDGRREERDEALDDQLRPRLGEVDRPDLAHRPRPFSMVATTRPPTTGRGSCRAPGQADAAMAPRRRRAGGCRNRPSAGETESSSDRASCPPRHTTTPHMMKQLIFTQTTLIPARRAASDFRRPRNVTAPGRPGQHPRCSTTAAPRIDGYGDRTP